MVFLSLTNVESKTTSLLGATSTVAVPLFDHGNLDIWTLLFQIFLFLFLVFICSFSLPQYVFFLIVSLFLMVLTGISTSIQTHSCCSREVFHHFPNRAAFISFVQVMLTLNDLPLFSHMSSSIMLVRTSLPCHFPGPTCLEGSKALPILLLVLVSVTSPAPGSSWAIATQFSSLLQPPCGSVCWATLSLLTNLWSCPSHPTKSPAGDASLVWSSDDHEPEASSSCCSYSSCLPSAAVQKHAFLWTFSIINFFFSFFFFSVAYCRCLLVSEPPGSPRRIHELISSGRGMSSLQLASPGGLSCPFGFNKLCKTKEWLWIRLFFPLEFILAHNWSKNKGCWVLVRHCLSHWHW